MGWPGPRRHPVTFRLSDDEEAPVKALAATLPPMRTGKPNLSAALRQIIAEWATHSHRGEPDEIHP